MTALQAGADLAAEERFEGGGPAGGGALRLIAVKTGSALITLLFVLVFNFFLFRVLPANPAKNLTRSNALTASQLAAVNRTFGLGRPLPEQFWNYLVQTLHGNLGRSFVNQEPVAQLIGPRLWPTVLLLGTSTVLATVIGVWIGIRGGWNRGSTFDRASTAVCQHAVRDAGLLAGHGAADRVRVQDRAVPRRPGCTTRRAAAAASPASVTCSGT